ncbi:hypothetical protein UFOVP613_41 [uncultured Caudovirales phage]|uniref:Uncharacterized protein n=1 Tax=uncultured Caudovirales phage TaxID=2100421 RepID=A0A6J5N2I1_9CAUD|nr:hypothetical protein UFOVP613_41 [uncultured Caudovirales phage]
MSMRDLPVVVNTGADFWKATGLIAGARAYGNRNHQFGSYMSRGAAGDLRTLIMGAWGELAFWIAAERSGITCTPPVLVSLSAPPKDIDFHGQEDGQRYGLEVKAWATTRTDGSPASRVNINIAGHARSIKRGGTHYVWVLGAPGGSASVIASPMPHSEVETWRTETGRYNDPMYHAPLSELAPRILAGRSFPALSTYLASTTGDADSRLLDAHAWRERAPELIPQIMEALDPTSANRTLANLNQVR